MWSVPRPGGSSGSYYPYGKDKGTDYFPHQEAYVFKIVGNGPIWENFDCNLAGFVTFFAGQYHDKIVTYTKIPGLPGSKRTGFNSNSFTFGLLVYAGAPFADLMTLPGGGWFGQGSNPPLPGWGKLIPLVFFGF